MTCSRTSVRKEVFLDTVRFKLSGRLEYLRRSESGKDEVFENILKPTENEHFSDLGAYNGDTIRELLHYTNGRFASVTALEPDRRSFRKLNEWASANIEGDVTLRAGGRVGQGRFAAFPTRRAASRTLRTRAAKPRCVRSTACSAAGRAPISKWTLRARSARRFRARSRPFGRSRRSEHRGVPPQQDFF